MSMEAMERFEMICTIGTVVIGIIFYIILAVVCFVISSKKKETNPADSKTWKTLGIVLVCSGAFIVVMMGAALLITVLLS